VVTTAPNKTADLPGLGDLAAALSNLTDLPDVPTFSVDTDVSVTMKLDISAFTAEQKTGVANGVAYGLHSSACKGVEDHWVTEEKCFQGEGKPGASFAMAMSVDQALGATQPTPEDYKSFGTARRSLEATELTNSGKFTSTFVSEDVAAAAKDTLDASLSSTAGADLVKDRISAGITAVAAAQPDLLPADVIKSVEDAVGNATVVAATSAPVADAPPAAATSGSVSFKSTLALAMASVSAALLF
jgi:hypothetical protein